MGTKNNPGKFDCYDNAEPDEPMFILLARDISAPYRVEEWADIREAMIDQGLKPESDRPMVAEARQCATLMREWRKENRPTPAPGILREGLRHGKTRNR
jgi:hypothetical protein